MKNTGFGEKKIHTGALPWAKEGGIFNLFSIGNTAGTQRSKIIFYEEVLLSLVLYISKPDSLLRSLSPSKMAGHHWGPESAQEDFTWPKQLENNNVRPWRRPGLP